MNWSDIREKTKREEKSVVCLIVVIFAFALIMDLLVGCGYVVIRVSNYENISLTVVQLQATVQTLSIALLALVAGRTNDSHMGISLNDFLFNIRPYFFTQRRIIFALIVLLILNVFLHILGLYNLVIAVFIISCLLILVSVKEIYDIFMGQGDKSTDVEVEMYIISYTAPGVECSQAQDILKKLCKGWCREIESQGILEYEKYLNMYFCFIDVLLLSDACDARKFINTETANLIRCFCKARNKTVKERSVIILDQFYSHCWHIIAENKEKALTMKDGIRVISEIYYDLTDVIAELSIKDIEDNIDLQRFMEEVILCYFWLGYNAKNTCEIASLSDVIISLELQLKKAVSYDSRYWGRLVESFHMRVSVLPDKYVSDAEKIECDIKLRYAIVLMKIGQKRILEDTYFDRAIKSIRTVSSECEVKLFLKIQCFLYYMAFYEDTCYIPPEDKKLAEQLLLDHKKAFSLGVEHIVHLEMTHPKCIFSDKLLDEFCDSLRIGEYLPQNGAVKTLVMDVVVDDFVVFLCMYLSNHYHYEALMRNIISAKNDTTLYMRFVQNDSANKRLSNFLRIVGSKENPESMLISFERVLRDEIKSNQMKRAEEEYSSAENNEIGFEDIKQKLRDYLNEKFAPIISENAKTVSPIKLHVLKINGFSNESVESLLDGNYNIIVGHLVDGLLYVLRARNLVDTIEKTSSKSENDDELLSYLKCDKDIVIIGSSMSFLPSNYKKKEEIDKIIGENKSILEGFTNDLLIVKEGSLGIYIQEIRVSTHSGTYADDKGNIFPSSDSQMYSYCVTNGISVDFSEEELLQYLHDKRKIIDITLYVSIKAEEDKIGTLLRDVLLQ